MPSRDNEKEASLLEQDFANLELDVMEIDERKAGAGDKAAADLPELALAEDGRVMVLVEQECISGILKISPRTDALRHFSVEELRAMGFTDEEGIQTIVMGYQAMQVLWDIKNDIIQQYLDKGYAYVPLPDSSERYPLIPGNLPPLP